jgi:hypothetical protein
MQTAILTSEDLELIERKIRPGNKKTLFYAFLILLMCSFFQPFVRGRYSREKSAYERGTYWTSFAFALPLYMSFGVYYYYRHLVCLTKDVNGGKKYVVQLPILSKKMIDDSTYEVVLEKGKLNIKEKVTIPKGDVYKWIKGDLVEVHFLKRSGAVLSYKTES